MPPTHASAYTAFRADRVLARGDLLTVAVAARAALAGAATVLVFDDRDGSQIDLNLSGDERALRRRYAAAKPIDVDEAAGPAPRDAAVDQAAPRARGRPKLGVIAREVTLLPRHWQWLAAQPGGASVTLRKLIEQQRKAGESAERKRRSREAGYRFIQAIAGDRAGAEDALRALFAGHAEAFSARIAKWPADLRGYLTTLTADAFDG